MLRKNIAGTASVLALLAAPVCMAAAINLVNVSHFRADCSGLLMVADDIQQGPINCKGTFIGDAATITFLVTNMAPVSSTFVEANAQDPAVDCAWKHGQAVITTNNGTITMKLGGSGCRTSLDGHGRFALTYTISAGTGAFAGVAVATTGSGSFSVGYDTGGVGTGAGAHLLIHIDGNITGVAEEGE